LNQVKGLCHVDYARQITTGQAPVVQFQAQGFLYGPIRLSANPLSPVYRQLVAPTAEVGFVADRRSLFFIRDPRDILVSAYYSFGYTHGLSMMPAIRAFQEARRQQIQALSLDDYALSAVAEVRQHFLMLAQLAAACDRGLVLRYEDLVEHFDRFMAQLLTVVELDSAVVETLFQQTRPRREEDLSSHRRSGQPGGFRDKLHPDTVDRLNMALEPVLLKFGYHP
jgi:hypothetical protein